MNKKGFVLWVVSGFVLVLVVMVIGFIVLVNNEIIKAEQQGDSLKAFFLAEAGIEKAIYEISRDGTYTSETATFGEGIYDVTVTSLAGTQKQIDASGYVPNKTSPRAQRSISVIADKETGLPLGGALTTSGSVTLKAQSEVDGGSDNAGIVTTDEDQITQQGLPTLTGNPPIKEVAQPVTFEDIFRITPDEMKALATVYTNPGNNEPADPTGINWVEGSVKYTSHTSGSGILIVSGDLEVTAHVNFDGVIYVMGNADLGAHVVISGGLVTEGNSTHRAHSSVTYNETAIDAAAELYPYVIVSWEETPTSTL